MVNRTTALKGHANAWKLETVEDEVMKYYVPLGIISEEEQRKIGRTRVLRNKILHCEFPAALKEIEALKGGKVDPSPGLALNVKGKSGGEILQMLLEVQEKGIEAKMEPTCRQSDPIGNKVAA